MPNKKYFLRHRNTVIGYFWEEGKDVLYETIEELADTVANWAGYPRGLIKRTSFHAMAAPLENYKPNSEIIGEWLSSRVFQKDRQDSHKLIKYFELYTYDAWEVCKKSKAITLNDDYWLSENLEETYESVHPRAKIKKSKNTTTPTVRVTIQNGDHTVTAKRTKDRFKAGIIRSNKNKGKTNNLTVPRIITSDRVKIDSLLRDTNYSPIIKKSPDTLLEEAKKKSKEQ